jgi:hypothetical protein
MLPGYRIIDLIYEGSEALSYKARRIDDGQLVILKRLKSEYPTIGHWSQVKEIRKKSTDKANRVKLKQSKELNDLISL